MKKMLRGSIEKLPFPVQRLIAKCLLALLNPWNAINILVPDTFFGATVCHQTSKLFKLPNQIRRKQAARKIAYKWLDNGFQFEESADWPHLKEAIHEASVQLDAIQGKPAMAYKKSFLQSTPIDLYAPESQPIAKLAVSERVVGAIAEYLGTVPVLLGAMIWYSPNTDFEGRSQSFHLDGEDVKQVKCFIFLDDVDENCGPLTIIGSGKSMEIYKSLKKKGLISQRNSKLDDAIIFEAGGSETKVIPLIGKAGSIAMVDTCNCWHFGSRPPKSGGKPRKVLYLHYATPFCRQLPLNSSQLRASLPPGLSGEIAKMVMATPC